MTTSTSNIPVSCNWYGNSYAITAWGGPLRLKTITLTASAEISVHFSIPSLSYPKSMPQLPFSIQDSQVLSKTLHLSLKQLQNLTLTAYFSEERPDFIRRIDRTGRIFRQVEIISSKHSIPLQVPTTLESNRAYDLEITSNQLQLSAQLVAGQQVPLFTTHPSLEVAIYNVSDLAKMALTEMLQDAIVVYALEILAMRQGQIPPNNPPKKPIIDETIEQVVQQIPPEQLMALNRALGALREKPLQASREREIELHQMAIKLCLQSLGSERIQSIISDVLKQTISPLPPQAAPLIQSLAQRFTVKYMQELK